MKLDFLRRTHKEFVNMKKEIHNDEFPFFIVDYQKQAEFYTVKMSAIA